MKILILAYDFPPLISISGQRPYSWYKYLPEYGMSVTVITRHWSKDFHVPVDYVLPTSQQVTREEDGRGNAVVRVPFAPNLRDKFLLYFGFQRFSVIRKALTLLFSLSQYVFFAADNKRKIYEEAEKFIQTDKPDLMISTGEPFILFRYGHLLSKEYGIPWISDYRDPWTSNQGKYKRNFLEKIQQWLFRKLEKKFVANTLFITTAAPSYLKEIEQIHHEKQTHVIYNGFDDSCFNENDGIIPSSEKFIITYTGIIYPHQKLEMFLDGLDIFITKEKIAVGKLEVRFYGLELWADAIFRIRQYKPHLQAYIFTYPKVPYFEMVTKLRESHLLLLLSKLGVDWLNAKVFDYLAAKRKILLVENDKGILEQIIHKTNGGAAASNTSQVAEVLYQEYRAFLSGISAESLSNDSYREFSRKKQAQRLAILIKEKFGK